MNLEDLVRSGRDADRRLVCRRPIRRARPTPDRAPSNAAADAGSEGLQEITVTASAARRACRTCRSRCRPSPAETLQQLNVTTLDDYIKYLPNVTTANNGPGQNEVFMRGLSAGSQPSQGSGSTGL